MENSMPVVVLTIRTLVSSATVQMSAGYWTQTMIGQWHGRKCSLTPYIRLLAIDSGWFHSLWIGNVVEITRKTEWQGSRWYNVLVQLVWPAEAKGGCGEMHMLSLKNSFLAPGTWHFQHAR